MVDASARPNIKLLILSLKLEMLVIVFRPCCLYSLTATAHGKLSGCCARGVVYIRVNIVRQTAYVGFIS